MKSLGGGGGGVVSGIMNGKVASLKAEVLSTQSNIITVQETHSRQKGKILMGKEFVTFEAIREKKGGGTMIAVHQDLNPKLIEEYSNDFELLVVEIDTKEENIRVITGYGPQENWEEERRLPFFIALEIEIEKATLAGKAVIIEMDANSKLGSKYIPEDPHGMTPNGSLLGGIIERQNLIVGNGSDKCQGVITRKRVTKNRTEQSVIDIILFSSHLSKHFVSMHIDEEKKHVLTRCSKTKKGIKVKESEHNVIITEFKCNIKTDNVNDKIEVYNLKNKECQSQFKKYTEETTMLSSTINEEDDINKVIKRFMKKLNGSIAHCFRKVRVNKPNNDNNDELFNKRRLLKNKLDGETKKELEKVNEAIAEKQTKNYEKLKYELEKIKTIGGKVNSKQLWKMKKQLCPRSRDAPSAMTDAKRNLLTSDKAIQNKALEVYERKQPGCKEALSGS